jgi:hypothetical protein
VDDRRRRFGRPVAGQLPLRGEREAAHARAAVSRCFADEQKPSGCSAIEMGREPLATELRGRVLVVRRADACARELRDEAFDVQAASLPLR